MDNVELGRVNKLPQPDAQMAMTWKNRRWVIFLYKNANTGFLIDVATQVVAAKLRGVNKMTKKDLHRVFRKPAAFFLSTEDLEKELNKEGIEVAPYSRELFKTPFVPRAVEKPEPIGQKAAWED